MCVCVCVWGGGGGSEGEREREGGREREAGTSCLAWALTLCQQAILVCIVADSCRCNAGCAVLEPQLPCADLPERHAVQSGPGKVILTAGYSGEIKVFSTLE